MSRTISDLSPKEREISNFIAQGLIPKEIAEKLGISTYTVRNHLKSIYRKLDIKRSGQLVAMVVRAEFVAGAAS